MSPESSNTQWIHAVENSESLQDDNTFLNRFETLLHIVSYIYRFIWYRHGIILKYSPWTAELETNFSVTGSRNNKRFNKITVLEVIVTQIQSFISLFHKGNIYSSAHIPQLKSGVAFQIRILETIHVGLVYKIWSLSQIDPRSYVMHVKFAPFHQATISIINNKKSIPMIW